MTVNLESATTDVSGNRLGGSPSPRILVVDDQPANVQLLGSLLGRMGCEVIPAFDGRTALKRLALRTPDLVLLDPLLPGLDGIETCRRIRLNPAWHDISVVFISTADDLELVRRALAAGGADYIKQPCSLAELAERLKVQLARKKNLRHPFVGGDGWRGRTEDELLHCIRELKMADRPLKTVRHSRPAAATGGFQQWRGNVSKLAKKIWIQVRIGRVGKTAPAHGLLDAVSLAASAASVQR